MIKILSDSTINKIAAGEVIERPASVVKELVENAIDAGATKIMINLEVSGKNLIVVSDNGTGMSKDEIVLAVKRHATSKLDESDLSNIQSFGFRGEALPSIAAISKFCITSRKNTKIHNSTNNDELSNSLEQKPEDSLLNNESYRLKIIANDVQKIEKVSSNVGTTIEVRDVFFATPARLKFLRTDRTELNAIVSVVKRIILSHPQISLTLSNDGKKIINVHSEVSGNRQLDYKNRMADIIGNEFVDNSALVSFRSDDIELFGYTSLPTYNKASSEDQFLFVNSRPVKDSLLSIALKIAYQDFIERGRHPVACIMLSVPHHMIDVNVHPAKTEIRFHNPQQIKNIFIQAIKDSLLTDGQRVSGTINDKMLSYMQKYSQNFQANKKPKTNQNLQTSQQFHQQSYFDTSDKNKPDNSLNINDVNFSRTSINKNNNSNNHLNAHFNNASLNNQFLSHKKDNINKFDHQFNKVPNEQLANLIAKPLVQDSLSNSIISSSNADDMTIKESLEGSYRKGDENHQLTSHLFTAREVDPKNTNFKLYNNKLSNNIQANNSDQLNDNTAPSYNNKSNDNIGRDDDSNKHYRLGNAKAQLYSTYIISQTEESVILVDQHAAHERLGYEKLKTQLSHKIVKHQQ